MSALHLEAPRDHFSDASSYLRSQYSYFLVIAALSWQEATYRKGKKIIIKKNDDYYKPFRASSPHCSWISSCLAKQNLLERWCSIPKVTFRVISVRGSFIIKCSSHHKRINTWKFNFFVNVWELKPDGLPVPFCTSWVKWNPFSLMLQCLKFGLIYDLK